MTEDDHFSIPEFGDIHVRMQIRIKDPTYHDEDGQLFVMAEHGDWRDAPIAPVADECAHEETICNECINEWGIDWWVKIILPDGREVGLNDVPGLEQL